MPIISVIAKKQNTAQPTTPGLWRGRFPTHATIPRLGLFCQGDWEEMCIKSVDKTQGLQINYGFSYSATVDEKMDTFQEQKNVPWPIRFCFGLTVILFKAYFLVLFTFSNSASSCFYPWNISGRTRSLTTPTSKPLELLSRLDLHSLLYHCSLLLCQGIVVNQKTLLKTRLREEEWLFRIEALAWTQYWTVFAQGQQILRLKHYLTL